MKKFIILSSLFFTSIINAQTNPAIIKWLFNTTGITGRHYVTGNTTPINDATLANVQQVRYSTNYAYINATGIPSYITGPYALGAVSVALTNNYVFKIPLNPVPKTGTATSVGMGAIAVMINGTVAYNNRDAATYNNAGQWHQNAVYFENLGFDCAHGHPGPMTADYHVHQNPTAFNFSTMPTSSVCNVYLADGLYVPNSSQHSPLIGFASDGYPIYGAYGYTDPLDTSSALKRITPSYRLRNITSRTTLPNGTAATGPSFTTMITSMLPNSTPLPAVLGAYSEDYEFVSGLGDLDIHNGRFCKTPEYPNGIYCNFTTIDTDGNPVYPYMLGDTYYGVVVNGFSHANVTETVTTFNPSTLATTTFDESNLAVNAYVSKANDVLVIQSSISQSFDRKVELIDLNGKIVQTQTLYQGSTMCYFDIETLYNGIYIVRVSSNGKYSALKVAISH